MAQILARHGTRCQEHPHRKAEERCDRCGQPFCDECLVPSERDATGARDWFCARCVALMDERTRRCLAESALAYRAARAAARARRVGTALAAAGALVLVTGAGALAVARTFGTATDQALPERAAACGELARIRSIGAIGIQAGEDAVNVLAYPHRAVVRLVGTGGEAQGPAAPAEHGPQTLVDECDVGWRHEGPHPLVLPVSLVLDTGRQGSYVQRIALWQDPHASRDAWVRGFELLASASEAGDDWVRLTLDRPGELRETTEPQWFEIVRPAAGGLAPPFPDIAELRRLQVRVLSTVGSAATGAQPGTRVEVARVALGEVAAFGPDVEVVIDNPSQGGTKVRGEYVFGPRVVNALARRPKFVLFINRSITAETHHIVSVGQEQNLDLRVGPNEARSGLFVAGRPGTYEFVCRTPGHAELGLTGRIVVR
jgi:plastocyanin